MRDAQQPASKTRSVVGSMCVCIFYFGCSVDCVALKVHCSLYAVCEPLHLAEWWAGEQLRNNERGAALDCFKKAIEVTPAMAARLIQVLKAEVTALAQQHQQHSSCCRV